ncbi:MAG TPA: hypothetical protein VFE24_00935 [Pirellulales bacterium]|nr:hypothetical protein [Pirellulales bacterium]
MTPDPTPQPLSSDRTPDPLPTDAKKPRPRRRWLRFGLKTLFVLTTICAAATWRGVSWRQSLLDEDANVKELRGMGMGVEVWRYHELHPWRKTEGFPWLTGFPPFWFAKLIGLEDLVPAETVILQQRLRNRNMGAHEDPDDDGLSFTGGSFNIDDKLLTCLARLRGVKSISIDHAQCPPDILQYLIRLPNLEDVSLSPAVAHGGEGLYWLAAAPKLKSLSLTKAKLSEDGFRALGQLKQLQILDLTGAACNDDNLRCIAAMSNLEELNLNGTSQITDTGVRELGALTHLRHLEIDWPRGITGDTLGVFAGSSLERLKIEVSDNNAKGIAKISSLQRLDLFTDRYQDNCTVPGMKVLRQLKNLTFVEFHRPFNPSVEDQLVIQSWFPKARVYFGH